MSVIKGQVIHKRNVSNKVVFIDIINPEDQKRHSVLFKTSENLCDQTVIDKLKRGKYKLHLGDFVEIHGNFDKELFLAKDFLITEKWADSHPNESFQPKPPTVKKPEQVCYGNLLMMTYLFQERHKFKFILYFRRKEFVNFG